MAEALPAGTDGGGMAIRLETRGGKLRIPVRVQARASRTEIAGEHGGALKVRIAAPPVDGAANDALLRFLAKLLGVARGAVRIASGGRGRDKVVEVQGADLDEVARRLESLVG